MSKESFAARLRELREKTGLSRNALSKKAGLSRQFISQLERGLNEPSWTTVQLLALALGVDFSELAEPDLQLPDEAPAKPRGRPKKGAAAKRES